MNALLLLLVMQMLLAQTPRVPTTANALPDTVAMVLLVLILMNVQRTGQFVTAWQHVLTQEDHMNVLAILAMRAMATQHVQVK